jgi:hypothetical protein
MGLLQPHGRGRRAFRRDALTEACPQPVIVVHSLGHAIAALESAVAVARAVTLLSAPEAGIYSGAGWFKALADAAHGSVLGAHFTAILDCGDDAGAAMAALRAGVAGLVFTGRADVAERLAAIAEQYAALVLTSRPIADLDLSTEFFADASALRRRCAALLGASQPGPG